MKHCMQLGPRKGIVFIISAPSGGGKTTLVNEVTAAFPGQLKRVVTCTTREPRVGEVHGVDYYFLNELEFQQKVLNNEFLEYTKTYDHFYGTLLESVIEQKKISSVFLVIDVKGALEVIKELEAVSIFISPPSIKELEKRIRQRMQDDEDELKKRLLEASVELEKSFYDYNLINDDFAIAVDVIKSIIIAESFRGMSTYGKEALFNK
jgi:guanylate kinase